MKAADKWRTRGSIALGATLLQAANVYVKAVNAVKRR